MTELAIIRRPKRVNTDLVGPLLYPPNPEAWQQPVWGHSVRLYHGTQDRWDPKKTVRVLLKPGKRYFEYEQETIPEPNGEHGTSYVALMEFVAACLHAGWYPSQCREILSAGLDAGPCAQFRWQEVRHPDYDWFSQTWTEIAESKTWDYYRKQIRDIKSNGTSPAGTITFNPDTKSPSEREFEFDEERLDALHGWLSHHPGLGQEEVKQQQRVLRNRKVVVRYLEELERRGLATFEMVPTGGKGRPRKVWSALSKEPENGVTLEQKEPIMEVVQKEAEVPLTLEEIMVTVELEMAK